MRLRRPFGESRKKRRSARQLALITSAATQVIQRELAVSAFESEDRLIGNNHPEELIVSLTSHGRRIETVCITIESLMRQSLPPDRIILCLGEDGYSEKMLPATLKRQLSRGLEIYPCRDLGPYTKFFYTMKRFPNSLIVTVDDDLIYPFDLLDQLYRSYKTRPNAIPCHRSHYIQIDKNGNPLRYKKWLWDHDDYTPSSRIFPTGVGGVLYFPGSLHEDVLDHDTFIRLSPNADDVWLKCMSLRAGTPSWQISDQSLWSRRFFELSGSQATALKRLNKDKHSGNDAKLTLTLNHYNLISSLASTDSTT